MVLLGLLIICVLYLKINSLIYYIPIRLKSLSATAYRMFLFSIIVPFSDTVYLITSPSLPYSEAFRFHPVSIMRPHQVRIFFPFTYQSYLFPTLYVTCVMSSTWNALEKVRKYATRSRAPLAGQGSRTAQPHLECCRSKSESPDQPDDSNLHSPLDYSGVASESDTALCLVR